MNFTTYFHDIKIANLIVHHIIQIKINDHFKILYNFVKKSKYLRLYPGVCGEIMIALTQNTV